MRIAIVTESFLPSVNGVTNSVLRLLEHADCQGHDALVIAPGHGPRSHLRFPIIRVPSVGIPRYRSFALGLPTPVVRRALVDFGPDVIYVAAPIGLGARAIRVGRSLNVPTLACYQTDLSGFLENYGLRCLGRIIWHWISWVHNMASRTLAPSMSSLTDLSANGVDKVYLWRRGVDVELFSPANRSDELRESWGLEGRLAVGYVGRLAHEKRVDDLKVLASSKNIRLIIVGDGPLRAKLQRELPNAVFAGFRSGVDLARYFASFDLFVHPGQNETFCQTIQEALSSGVPVVAPAKGGPIDLVQQMRNGLLYEPGDLEHLSRCVHLITADEALRNAMSSSARSTVESRTWRMIGEQWEQHLAEVCAERAGHSLRVA